MIKDNPQEILYQDNLIDQTVEYLNTCFKKVAPLIPLPTEKHGEFLQGFDPIAYRAISELEVAIDKRDIDYELWTDKAQQWKAAWVAFLRRVYQKLDRS